MSPRTRKLCYVVCKRAIDLAIAWPAMLFAGPVLCASVMRRRHGRGSLDTVVLLGRNGRHFHSYVSTSSVVHRSARLWDVARGHASLVGPRLRPEAEMTAEEIELRRTAVPGLLCLQWVRWRGNVAFVPEVVADREYVEHRSLKFDLLLVLRCLLVSIYGAHMQSETRIVDVLGVNIDNVSVNQALMNIEAAVVQRAVGTQVSFVNADCLNKAATMPHYKAALAGSQLVLADGIGIKMAGTLLRRPIRQNVNGTDLFPILCKRLDQWKGKLFLLGGRPNVIAALKERIQREYPEIDLCGALDGYFQDEEAVVSQIAQAKPDVLLVALGAPNQELFIARNRDRLGAAVCIGVGGLFDFYSGRIQRAPQWLRDAGLEWTYRLYQEPGRMWKRYLVGNFTFLTRVFAEKLGFNYRENGQAVIG